MKKLFIVSLYLFIHFSFSQKTEPLDTWIIGVGLNNSIMHGDLTTINSNVQGINLGYYVYLQKMISPTFGFELKGQALSLQGASQKFISPYSVMYTTENPNNLYFTSDTFGGEFNVVVNLTNSLNNPYLKESRKFNFNAYMGLGYHTYNSKLYRLDNDELLIDYGTFMDRGGLAKSIYFSTALGIRYKISHRLDLELRQTLNFNNEDNLDAAISSKQMFESFF